MGCGTFCIRHEVDKAIIVLLFHHSIKHYKHHIFELTIDIRILSKCLQETEFVEIFSNKYSNEEFVSFHRLLYVLYLILKGVFVSLLTEDFNSEWTCNICPCFIEISCCNVSKFCDLFCKLIFTCSELLLVFFNLITWEGCELNGEYITRQTLDNTLLVEEI